MSRSLTQRLQALADTYKQTLNLIQELQNFPNSQPPQNGAESADEHRVELANEIHDSLKEQEDSLELLRQEVDESIPSATRQKSVGPGGSSSRGSEQERNVDLIARLTEDLKSARAKFRRAQLQAKKNADAAKRKEREALFKKSDNAAPSTQPRRPGQEKVTQEELAMNAAEDVTRALRRAHDLLSGNLSQSQFAQQTLDESQAALAGLSESYGGTGDLLKNSRSLVGQLVRSNKSDTWYLRSAFYMLAVTIAWLVFRRIFYGPLWWLVWQPLRLMWWTTLTSLGAIGFGTSPKNITASPTSIMAPSSVTARDIPTNAPGVQFRSMHLPAKGGGWHQNPPPAGETMVDQVGRMVEEAAINGGIGAETARQSDEPRNTKKRMMEMDDAGVGKDEL